MRPFTTGAWREPRKNKRLLRAIAALLGVTGLWLAACDVAPASPPEAPAVRSSATGQESASAAQRTGRASAEALRPKIVAFGDSLTAGLGVPQQESYPARLQQRLAQAGYDYEVVNAGVSGDTTAGGLRRVDWLLKSKPEIVILELGANDGLRGLDLRQTAANLQKIIQRLKEAGVTVVLAGMKIPSNYGVDYTRRFAALYADLARTHRLPYMPFFLEGVATQQALNQADGIHPTGEGYRIIVDNLWRVLEPLLKKSAGSDSKK